MISKVSHMHKKKQQLPTLHPVTASLFLLPVTPPLLGPLEGLCSTEQVQYCPKG